MREFPQKKQQPQDGSIVLRAVLVPGSCISSVRFAKARELRVFAELAVGAVSRDETAAAASGNLLFPREAAEALVDSTTVKLAFYAIPKRACRRFNLRR